MVVQLWWQPCCARDVEVFFKLLKSNFKFSNLKEHHKTNTINKYNKLYYSILIIIYISLMINKINDKYNKSIDKNKNNQIIKRKIIITLKQIKAYC